MVVKPATERDVRFYGCLILAVVTLPHPACAVFFALALWPLWLDLRDEYREADRRLGGTVGEE